MAGDDFQAPPLYDPSGLSFSLSADADLVGSFDASSFAAHRLGIGVPAKSYPEFASASSLPQGVPEPDLDAEAEAREAFDASVHPADPGSAFAAARPRKRRSYSSPGLAPSPVPPPPEQTQPRLDWWTAASPSPSLVPPSLPPSAQASPAQPKPQPQPPPPSQPHPQPQPRSQPQPRTSAPSDAAGKEGTQGPASAERLASPLRPTQGSPSNSWIHDRSRRFSDAVALPAPERRLYGIGTRVGPEGRFLLGQLLAYGGFSIVHEVIDLKEVRSASTGSEQSTTLDTTPPHSSHEHDPSGRLRPLLAGKLIYSDEHGAGVGGTCHQPKAPNVNGDWMSQEMKLWSTLPPNDHVLPLIWHESVALNNSSTPISSSMSHATRVDVLIMPLCDAGSLLDYVRNEGVPKPFLSAGTSAGPMSRRTSSASHPSTSLPYGPGSQIPGSPSPSLSVSRFSGMRTPSASRPTSISGTRRTGGGLSVQIPITSGVADEFERRPAADAVFSAAAGAYRSSINCDLPSAHSSVSGPSFARTTSLRRAGSTASNTTSANRSSRGLPLNLAREVLVQVTEGLHALHHQAKVVHNDIKLDNILGIMHPNDTVAHDDATTNSADDQPVLEFKPGARITWKISDFGLAAPCGDDMNPHGTVQTDLGAADDTPPSTLTTRGPSQRVLARGGSIPYAAPELLRAFSPEPSQHITAARRASSSQALPTDHSGHMFKADMWALGCVLYALLSGRLPFRDQFEPRLQAKIQKGEWEMPIRLRRRVAKAEKYVPDQASVASSTQPATFSAMPSAVGRAWDRSGKAASGSPSSHGGSFPSLSLARARTRLERSGSRGARVVSTSGLTDAAGLAGHGHTRNLSGSNIAALSPLSQSAALEDLSTSTPSLTPSTFFTRQVNNSPGTPAHALWAETQASTDVKSTPSVSSFASSISSRTDPRHDLQTHDSRERSEGGKNRGGPAPAAVHAVGLQERDSKPDEESDADPLSDEETQLDTELTEWNSTSYERVMVRQVLRGLLNPDPSARWDVNRLARSPWLSTSPHSGFGSMKSTSVGGAPKPHERPSPSRSSNSVSPNSPETTFATSIGTLTGAQGNLSRLRPAATFPAESDITDARADALENAIGIPHSEAWVDETAARLSRWGAEPAPSLVSESAASAHEREHEEDEQVGPLMPGAMSTPEDELPPLPQPRLMPRASRDSLPFLGFVEERDQDEAQDETEGEGEQDRGLKADEAKPLLSESSLIGSSDNQGTSKPSSWGAHAPSLEVSYSHAHAHSLSHTHSRPRLRLSRSTSLMSQSLGHAESRAEPRSGGRQDRPTPATPSGWAYESEPRGRAARRRPPPTNVSGPASASASKSASRSRSRFRTPVSSGTVDLRAAQRRSLSRSRTRADEALAFILDGNAPPRTGMTGSAGSARPVGQVEEAVRELVGPPSSLTTSSVSPSGRRSARKRDERVSSEER